MRDGYRIIDTDTHVGPTADVLYEYGSEALLARRAELEPYERAVPRRHRPQHQPVSRTSARWARRPRPEQAERGGAPALKGAIGSNRVEDARAGRQPAQRRRPPARHGPRGSRRRPDHPRHVLDRHHRDRRLRSPSSCTPRTTATSSTTARPTRPAEGDDPGARRRPGVGGRARSGALAGERCVAAVTVVLPEGMPVDDPDLHPIWAAMGDADLPLLHHSFFYEPPYFPGLPRRLGPRRRSPAPRPIRGAPSGCSAT